MAPEQMHILRVPLSDSSEDAYVLINVSSNGPSPLDLKLLATEGTAPYIARIKPSRISKLRSKRNPLTPTDWSTTLQSFLCQNHSRTSPPLQAKDLSKLEATASLSSSDSDTLTLHLRHNISGILLSLGTITFTKDESQEIDIFAWCALSVQHSNTLQTTIQTLNEQLIEQKETFGKLEQQLEDLIQAKKVNEEELLAKFALLLNEKKLKIREQQRLLAGAKINPNAAKNVGKLKEKEVPKGRTPQPSRKGKRKIDVKDESENEDEDGFEDNHRVATAGAPGVEDTDANESERQADTPDPSDQDITEDDGDGDGDDLAAAGKDQVAAKTDLGKETHKSSKNDDEKIQIDSLPPSRELPFGKPDTSASAGKETTATEADKLVLNQEAGNEDDETEGDEDDDEL